MLKLLVQTLLWRRKARPTKYKHRVATGRPRPQKQWRYFYDDETYHRYLQTRAAVEAQSTQARPVHGPQPPQRKNTGPASAKTGRAPKSVREAVRHVLRGKRSTSLKEKVHEALDLQQARNQFSRDKNQRVAGSAKETRAIRDVSYEMIVNMDDVTAARVVTKKRLLGEIDWKKFREAGESPALVFMKKTLIDSLAARPPDSHVQRLMYVAGVEFSKKYILGAKSVHELMDWRKKTEEDHIGWQLKTIAERAAGIPAGQITFEEALRPLEETLPGITRTVADFDRENFENGKARQVLYEVFRRIGEYVRRDVEPPNAPFNLRALGPRFRGLMARSSRSAYRVWTQALQGRPTTWDFLEPRGGGARQTTRDANFRSVPLEHIERTGGRPVVEAELTAASLTDAFGMKSVQFGASVKDKEAREHLRHFIASMKDLEDALELDVRAFMEKGGLSLAIGARGHAGTLAHYEPRAQIVNLTNRRGDGSVAHELAHYLDNMIGEAVPGRSAERIYGTALPARKYPGTNAALSALMGAIRRGESGNTTAFLAGASEFGRPYWTRPWELFARAQEAYVQDKLEEKGMRNDYLVRNNRRPDPAQPATDSYDAFLSRAYPQGDERRRINAAFDKFYAEVRKELKLGRTPPASA